ncbi:hypothetical protein ALC57_18724 [Trachymyrmex cornetzi]|uniref:DNA-directed DNA polymerase n=1 Tax=Trachymyrmex cornetzi TaxID=471704 RepID=A0A151IRI8_9HYME|nr:hypothetical protein ALC57_18724 [Trachymyrmex cornetzi]
MTQSGFIFDFQRKIVKYCRNVDVLRRACLAFRKIFLERGSVRERELIQRISHAGEGYQETEGIVLDKNNIARNPGIRSVAKLCLNSFWGKFGQRSNLPNTEIVKITKLSCGSHHKTYIDIDPNNGNCIIGKATIQDKPDEIPDTLLWLKNSSQPWSKVLDYWQQTYDLRWSELLTSNFSIGQYIAQYPALDNEKGTLELDFEKRNPEKALKLFCNWPKLSEFLFNRLKAKIKDFCTDTVSQDLKTLKVLTFISHLFASVNARKQRKEIKEWRPSKIEMQEGFLLHVKVIFL